MSRSLGQSRVVLIGHDLVLLGQKGADVPETSTRSRLGGVVASALVALLTAACATSAPHTTASESTTRPSAALDKGLRPVKMVYSDGIAYVEAETAAQMICGALSPPEWRHALGDGPTPSRTVYGEPVGGSCLIASGSLTAELRMDQHELATIGVAEETIAGHTVRFGSSLSTYSVDAAAAVVSVGEDNLAAQQRVHAFPVLRIVLDEHDLRAHPNLPPVLRNILTVLLPRLTTNGPPTPLETAGKLVFTPTDPIPGVAIYDLPGTVQSQILCTVAVKETPITPPPTAIQVNAIGQCIITEPDRMDVEMDPLLDAVREQFTIAGHPAQIDQHGVQINLLTLTNENQRVSHPGLRLTRHNLDGKPDQLRTWAEQVAEPLLPN